MNSPSTLKRPLACLCFILSAVSFQPMDIAAQVAGAQTGMATRSVTKYLALERSLLEATAQQNREGANQLLDAEFESRISDGNDPVAHDDWLNHAFSHSHSAGQIRDLTVFETDGVALVSFTLDLNTGKNKTTAYFIVDAWQQATDRLLVRYQSKPVSLKPRSKRPDGKE